VDARVRGKKERERYAVIQDTTNGEKGKEGVVSAQSSHEVRDSAEGNGVATSSSRCVRPMSEDKGGGSNSIWAAQSRCAELSDDHVG
jgi:hypothetical protein